MSLNRAITATVMVPSTTGSPMISHCKERFAEVTSDVTYRGFNFFITIDEVVFTVRHYDDLPGVSTIISPKTAGQLPQASLLVDYLVSALGCRRILFSDESGDTYREVDAGRLDFTTSGSCAA